MEFPVLWILSTFYGCIRILWILWIHSHFVDIICIDHITSYLAHNIRPIFHIYSSSVSDWCIPSLPVCDFICFSVASFVSLVCFVSDYKLNTNPIWIYVPSFYHINQSFFISRFPPRFACCIGVLYKHVLWISCCMPVV